MISIKTIWKDPVMSKIIALGLVSGFSNLLLWIPKISEKIGNWFGISICISISIVVIFCLVLWKRWKKLSIKEQLREISGEKISLKKLNSTFPKVEKISILGKSNVGKTTLIENICTNENQNELTIGTGAYIKNFSSKIDKFAAILDGSGQSQSEQNDIALESQILIILIDHNLSKSEESIDRNRIRVHKEFLLLLKDRFKRSNHNPKWIHFLLNKEDLWGELSLDQQNEFKSIFNQIVGDFRDNFQDTKITKSYHSNDKTKDRTAIMSEIAKNIA